MKNQNILFTWFLDDIRCYVFLIISLHSPQQTPSGSIPILQLGHSPWIAPSSWLCSQVSMERSSGVPVKRSVLARGWRSRYHKMIHNGKNAENPLLTVFWGRTWKNTEIFHSKSFGSSHPFQKNWEVDDLKTYISKYLSEKQTYNGRALGALTAWLARRWVSKDVWGVTGGEVRTYRTYNL